MFLYLHVFAFNVNSILNQSLNCLKSGSKPVLRLIFDWNYA